MTSKRSASIVSSLPGRLRLRHPALRRRSVAAEVAAALAGRPGMRSAEANPRTGGLLITWDAALLPLAEAEAAALAALAAASGGKTEAAPATEIRSPPRRRFAATYRRIRVPVNVGMLVTLGGSVVALAASRRAHAALGVAHLGFLALHLVQYRRRLVT